MRLAVIDAHDQVLLAWPTVTDAHADLAELAAAHVHPRSKWRRRKLAGRLRTHLLALQAETVRL